MPARNSLPTTLTTTAIALLSLSALSLTTAQSTIIPGTTGKLGNASITTSNPIGVTYQAFLPDSNTTTLRGYIAGTSNSNGTGVNYNINFYGFPSEAEFGPFIYHIHQYPVPSDGNCTGTGAHLDPTVRGEAPPCDPSQPEECQVGDLAGKYGNITGSPFQKAYLDLYTSTSPSSPSFFGNLSVVIHTTNKTRLTCANFSIVAGASPSTTTSAPGSTATAFSGGASGLRAESFGGYTGFAAVGVTVAMVAFGGLMI
ncbi:hypothetical protein MMC25_007812 [Agyrium rufum]|nr:hypothetical protein [Agyrium rufum]